MDFLKDVLGDELYQQVETKLKDSKLKLVDLAAGGYVAKEKFTAAQQEAKDAIDALKQRDDDLKQRDKDLAKIKAEAGDSEELQKQVTDLQAEYKETAKLNADNLTKVKLTSAVALEIIKAGPKDENAITAISALLDHDLIKLDGEADKVLGLTEQLATLKETSAYLFGTVTPTTTPGGNPADPPEPPDPSDYQAKLDKARSDKNNLEVIKVKQEAHDKGIPVN